MAVDSVVLVDIATSRKYVVRLKNRRYIKLGNIGVIKSAHLKAKKFGDIKIGGKKFIILPVSITDCIETLQRGPQIISLKDSALIIVNCNIKSGDTVVECGTGCGALTIVLANIVKPTGKVITYEKRADFAAIARTNILNAGLEKYVILRNEELPSSVEDDVDAFVADIPTPWNIVECAKNALKAGGYFGCFLPTVNQVEKTVLKLKKHKFYEIKTVELLERELVVRKGATRPSFSIFHTGYLIFARKYK